MGVREIFGNADSSRKINKEMFGEVLERASLRLSSWKSCMLSFTGRITLTKAVLSSIPVHSMSIIKLPVNTLSKLDRVSRDFVWESTADKRKQHLIAWNRVCLPKNEGGIGIRKAVDMNKALLTSIA